MDDESYIKLTLSLAKKGMGKVSPNPLVGCVLVKKGKIIGAGYHQEFGGPHAEINAINNASEPVEGATLYVNLEPCNHTGKTPPCTEAIIANRINRVVVGTLDINPIVGGSGIQRMLDAGIDVRVGVLEKDCIELNKFFFKAITAKMPYITLKIAQTLDGKIADGRGMSKWITSEPSRRTVHFMRTRYDAVLIGSKTIRVDNPQLTVRLTEGRNPDVIILDTGLSLGLQRKLFTVQRKGRIIIVTGNKSKEKGRKIEKLRQLGVEIIFAKVDRSGVINLRDAMKKILNLGINSILVEGGSKVFTAFLKSGLFDELRIFISPKVLGKGIPAIGDLGIKSLSKSIALHVDECEMTGDDVVIKLRNNEALG